MLKGNWTPKQDDIDFVMADDINAIAEAIIDLEDAGGIDLSQYLSKALFDSYIDGALTMPNPIVDRLDVITHATFDGTVSVNAPISDNHPATKKYVDDAISRAIQNLPIYNGEVEE